MFEMTAVRIRYPQIKRWSPYVLQAQKKLLTSFVGDALGSAVGLDDGCSSEDREQEISCVSKV